ncbi:MAG: DUF6268 family outer membrane beta-barrel protein [Phycisphaerales bacterium]|jgi:hypothetical protein
MRLALALSTLLTFSGVAWAQPVQEAPPADPPASTDVAADEAQADQTSATQPAESAEDASPAQAARPPMPTFLYTVDQSIYATNVPHIDGGGRVTSTLTRTEFDLVWLASQRTRAVFQLSNEFAFYDFDDAFRLDPIDGEPAGSFNRQNIDVLVNHNLDRRWSLIALGGIGLARERNADVSDSIVWRAGFGTAYQVTENISLGATLLASASQEGSVEIFPLPAIDATFEFDDRWTLRLGTIQGARLTYKATEELDVSLRAGYNERNYRLDDDGFAPGGVFQDKSVDLRLGVDWRPAPGLEVNAGVGSELWRRFKILDDNGNRLSRVETDPSIVFFAGVSYRF